jgi:potassium efflux system protein
MMPARGSCARVVVSAALVASIACGSHSVAAAEAVTGAGQVSAGGAAGPSGSGAAGAAALHDLVVDLGRNDVMRREIAANLRETSNWPALAGKLQDPTLASDLRALEEGRDTLSRAHYMELIDADTRIRERARAVSAATTALGNLTQKVEEDLERLDGEVARWPQRVALAREREAPAEILRRVEAAGPELAAARDRLRARRDELLVAYERGVALQARLDAVRETIAERRERITTELRSIEDAPLWRQGPVVFPRDEVLALARLSRLELVDYLRQHGVRLAVMLVVLGSLMFVALRHRPAPAPGPDADRARSMGPAVAGALLGSLVVVAVLAPRAPFILYRLIAFVVPLAGGVVAVRTFAASIPATAWTLVLAVFVNEFRIIAEMNPATDRLLLAIQILPFGAALLHDWRRGALARFLPRWPPVLVQRLATAVLLALGVIAIASVLGSAGAARRLAALVVMAPGFALVFKALAWVLDRASDGLLATPIAQSLRSVRDRREAVRRALHLVIVLFCWAAGIVAFMVAHSALDDLLRLGNYVAGASITTGDVTITFSAILSAIAVVGVTWLSTKLVRFVLDHEVLPRLNLRTGVPIAISTIVGYLLVVTGFVLALAALGIDLTKVTLLAGALGVGVGLGLQSVVNNFASGLILMLERPINVGDQIDVGGVLGEVKRIGVRSSTIRTFQGAEVIVPNADLASKQVINWTLSDRARRYEIDVGVAYGSDPAQVLRLLEDAAASVPEVQKVPVPRALFTGFGDSSLDFRLFAWVESVDIGLQAQNTLRTAILRLLDQAGIEIPFPQRDIHIRRAPATPR